MFAFLGRVTTRHPWWIIGAWILVLVASAVLVLTGLGHGGLFARMATSEYVISGSDSEKVHELTTGNSDAGPTSILIVSGVDTNDPAVQEFASKHRDILEGSSIDSVVDTFSVKELRQKTEADAQKQLQQEIADQIALAMQPVEAEAQAQAEQAKSEIQAQVDQAAAMGPEAQAAAQAQADVGLQQVDEQTQQAIEAARTEVTAQVTEAVKQAADEAANEPEVRKQREEAERAEASMLGESGTSYAVVVNQKNFDDKKETDAARDQLEEDIDRYESVLRAEFPKASVSELSSDSISSAIMQQVQSDLVKGEALGLPVAALIMLIVFGGALAAGMPLVGAISAVVTGMGILWISTWVTGIDAFILNVVSIIGLSLSIDYGLLLVSRFREEGNTLLAEIEGKRAAQTAIGIRRAAVIPAVKKTMETAGRTITFSAVTIAVAISGIFFINVHMLRIIAWGGIIVTLLAVLATLTAIPALLTLIGGRLLKPSPITRIPGVGRVVAAVGDSSSDKGIFSRLAHAVHRRPWLVMGATFVILVIMAIPIRGLEMRSNSTEYIPDGTSARVAFDAVEEDFPELATPAIQAVIDAPDGSEAANQYVANTEVLPGVTAVQTEPLPNNDQMTVVSVRVDAEDQVGSEVRQVVHDMRDLDVGSEAWVGGAAATQNDFGQSVTKGMPAALATVGAVVLILLFLMTGSVIVPIKALLINALSIIAALGATTAVFQNGWFGLPKTLGLETFIVVCMVAFGFGLSMDYEVFLLARIREYWDKGFDNDDAVAAGLQRSGRIITSAAAIVIAVFIGFALGDLIVIKQLGVGLAIMVAVDATIVRMLLVPATMTVLGKWNWWAPAPLARFAKRFSLQH